MVRQILFLLHLFFVGASGNQLETCNLDQGLMNMTFIVQTLNQVVDTGAALSGQIHEEVIQEVRNISFGVKDVLHNISEILAQVVQKQEQQDRNLEWMKVKLFRYWSSMNKSKLICDAGELYYTEKTGQCGSCYNFDFNLRTWDQSRRNCESQGGDLVSIETAAENQFLMEIVLKHNKTILPVQRTKGKFFGFWTSGSDIDKEGTWIWKATGAPMVYKNWDDGQPNNYVGNQHVMALMVIGGNWSDDRATERMYAFCEKLVSC